VTGRWFPRWRWIATEIDRRLVSDQNLKWFDVHVRARRVAMRALASIRRSEKQAHCKEKKAMSERCIGVVGLGAMGTGMAKSLRRGGYNVYVFDVRSEVARDFAAEGGVACESPAAVAGACEVLVSVVVNSAQTEAVLFGAGGAAEAMKAGSVFVMCSTVAPEWSIALEKRLAEKGILYLDAPISGGAVKAAKGEITMMTSGHPDAYAKAGGALDAMAAKVYRLGAAAGDGSKIKMINQLLAGVHIAVAAEAMALGLREGVDPAALYEVITHSAGNSWMFENRMAHVLAGDYTPLSAVDIFVKDLGLVVDAARANDFPASLASKAHEMFLQASRAGYGREDDSAVIKIFPGIALPGKG
jgi:putative dehydrogenase